MAKRDPYDQPLAFTEIDTKGQYVGQCRKLFNILEQWNGKKWMRVPEVLDRRPQKRGPIHFDVDDFGRL